MPASIPSCHCLVGNAGVRLDRHRALTPPAGGGPLYHFEPPVADDEVRAASLQFVRKVSGFG